MIYNFAQISTPRGRAVRFCIDAGDFFRAHAALDSARRLGVLAVDSRGPESRSAPVTCVTATIAGAAGIAEKLGELGGDAAVASRLLSDRLDALVLELRESRTRRARVPA